MKQTVSASDLRTAFHDMGRADHFSYQGLGALHKYLEELETETGVEIELDVIARDCEFCEYPAASDAADAMGRLDDFEGDVTEEEISEYLRDHFQVIEVSGGGVIIGERGGINASKH